MGYQGPLEGKKKSFSARDSDRMLRHEIAKLWVGQQPQYSKKASQYSTCSTGAAQSKLTLMKRSSPPLNQITWDFSSCMLIAYDVGCPPE